MATTGAGALARAHSRARRDPVARVIAAAAQAGIRFMFVGEQLVVRGAAGLAAEDRAVLEQLAETIRARLLEPEPEADPVAELGVEVVLVDDAMAARGVLRSLGKSVGLDIETEPLAPCRDGRWIAITKSGRRAKHQPAPKDGAALDPLRARPRLIQVYHPEARAVHVFDLHHVPLDALDGLWSRTLVIHNAAFELAMLRGRPRGRVIDGLQLAGLAFGCEAGARSLEAVARSVLGVELPKGLQASDWSAPALSDAQLDYAAVDAVVAHRAARAMWRMLGPDERRAFKLQNAVVPIAAAMRFVGVPFDKAVHRETIGRWEREHSEARQAFVDLTGEEPPPPGPRRSAWLEARMPAEELAWWPRTATGTLSTASTVLERLAAVPEVRPLLDVLAADKLLRAFGRTLLERVDPGSGRVHPDWKPCWTKAGRWSCGTPNVQQLPLDARKAVIAPPGRTLVVADYSQIELRVLAEVAGEAAMRRAFAAGQDLHRLTAAAVSGLAPDEVTPAQRQAAKALNFGLGFGMGARKLAGYAYTAYRVEMSEDEARAARDAWFRQYPAVKRWQRENYHRATAAGVLRTIAGRPVRAEWEHGGELKYTLCCNFPIQGSAADVMLLALPGVVRALAGLDAVLILQVHDELVVECAEDAAGAVAAALEEHMTAAFADLFPDAPTRDLVEARAARRWGDAK